MLAPSPTCENCKYGEKIRTPTKDNPDLHWIKCRRLPQYQSHSPDDWCGEYSSRNPINGIESIHDFITEAKQKIRKNRDQ